jgi:hypothetical protein
VSLRGERCSCRNLVSDSSDIPKTMGLTFSIVDAYRNKMRSSMMGQGQDVTQVAPHFETRVGKRRWNERIERNKKMRREGSP